MKPAEFREITQNNGHYNVQGRSRSPILVPISVNWTFFAIGVTAEALRAKIDRKSAISLKRG